MLDFHVSSSPSRGHLGKRGTDEAAAAQYSTWKRPGAPKSPDSSYIPDTSIPITSVYHF